MSFQAKAFIEPMIKEFLAIEPKLEDYWRSIVLFGRNTASYKFALAKSLLELRPQSGQLVTLEELAAPFSRQIATHLKNSDRQATGPSSRFLAQCRLFNNGDLTSEDLVKTTVELGFKNVIDAFHVVRLDEVPQRFFVDERGASNGIRITDEFSKLVETEQVDSLPAEVEARWRLVETAWSREISRNLLHINYDAPTERLFVLNNANRRVTVTSSRDALNGYQKGKCFYCFRTVSLSDESLKPEVDHFFPHVLRRHGFGALVDGVWNLVLCCRDCNRGEGGKFDRVPSIDLLKRLNRRNSFLISSHHPLRETLLRQTGLTPEERHSFLQAWHTRATKKLIHQWKPEEVDRAIF